MADDLPRLRQQLWRAHQAAERTLHIGIAAELSKEDTLLCLEVFNHRLRVPVHPTSDGKQDEWQLSYLSIRHALAFWVDLFPFRPFTVSVSYQRNRRRL
jgi:hypothetical protein